MTATRNLARAGLIVSGAFLTSRILGWLRIVVIPKRRLARPELDAFFAAFRIPDLMFQLVAAGALSSALIPIVSGLFATDEPARAWRVVSTVANLVHGALLVLGLIVLVAAPAIIPLITPGFDAAQTAKTVELTRIMLLSPIFLALGAVATSVLNSGGRFAAVGRSRRSSTTSRSSARRSSWRRRWASTASPSASSPARSGTCSSRSGRLPRLGFRYAPRIDLGDDLAERRWC